MWKRDEPAKPAAPAANTPPQTVTPSPESAVRPSVGDHSTRGLERSTVNIGKSVVIKGELTGSEDLTIEGQVDGKIELRQNVLTIGANGKIKAQVFAKAVIILGEVTGNVTASEKVDIRDNGSVDGDITSPRVAIAEGAHFRGSIDMQREKGEKSEKAEVKPAATATPASSGTTAPAGASR
jgi:cytoskeletal protein CcmA (bactofilin family)